MTYDVRAQNPYGTVSSSRLRGTRAGDGYELVGLDDNDSEIVARLSLTSWQPYQTDALSDCLRVARDLCNVVTVRNGNQLAFEPVEPPDVEALQGAKEPAGAGLRIGGSVSAVAIHMLDNDEVYRLDVGMRLAGDLDLRADLDTWRLAMLEEDGATRFIHYHRIYESEARSMLDNKPQLLNSDEIDACAESLVAALPQRLTREQRERVDKSVRGLLPRLRERSRPTVLAERLSARLEREITPAEIRRMEDARARYAHESTDREAKPGAEEQLIHDVALALLREVTKA